MSFSDGLLNGYRIGAGILNRRDALAQQDIINSQNERELTIREESHRANMDNIAFGNDVDARSRDFEEITATEPNSNAALNFFQNNEKDGTISAYTKYVQEGFGGDMEAALSDKEGAQIFLSIVKKSPTIMDRIGKGLDVQKAVPVTHPETGEKGVIFAGTNSQSGDVAVLDVDRKQGGKEAQFISLQDFSMMGAQALQETGAFSDTKSLQIMKDAGINPEEIFGMLKGEGFENKIPALTTLGKLTSDTKRAKNGETRLPESPKKANIKLLHDGKEKPRINSSPAPEISDADKQKGLDDGTFDARLGDRISKLLETNTPDEILGAYDEQGFADNATRGKIEAILGDLSTDSPASLVGRNGAQRPSSFDEIISSTGSQPPTPDDIAFRQLQDSQLAADEALGEVAFGSAGGTPDDIAFRQLQDSQLAADEALGEVAFGPAGGTPDDAIIEASLARERNIGERVSEGVRANSKKALKGIGKAYDMFNSAVANNDEGIIPALLADGEFVKTVGTTVTDLFNSIPQVQIVRDLAGTVLKNKTKWFGPASPNGVPTPEGKAQDKAITEAIVSKDTVVNSPAEASIQEDVRNTPPIARVILGESDIAALKSAISSGKSGRPTGRQTALVARMVANGLLPTNSLALYRESGRLTTEDLQMSSIINRGRTERIKAQTAFLKAVEVQGATEAKENKAIHDTLFDSTAGAFAVSVGSNSRFVSMLDDAGIDPVKFSDNVLNGVLNNPAVIHSVTGKQDATRYDLSSDRMDYIAKRVTTLMENYMNKAKSRFWTKDTEASWPFATDIARDFVASEEAIIAK